jgi:hypothetical protein
MSGTAEPEKMLPEPGLTPSGASASDAPDHADPGDEPSQTG